MEAGGMPGMPPAFCPNLCFLHKQRNCLNS